MLCKGHLADHVELKKIDKNWNIMLSVVLKALALWLMSGRITLQDMWTKVNEK